MSIEIGEMDGKIGGVINIICHILREAAITCSNNTVIQKRCGDDESVCRILVDFGQG